MFVRCRFALLLPRARERTMGTYCDDVDDVDGPLQFHSCCWFCVRHFSRAHFAAMLNNSGKSSSPSDNTCPSVQVAVWLRKSRCKIACEHYLDYDTARDRRLSRRVFRPKYTGYPPAGVGVWWVHACFPRTIDLTFSLTRKLLCIFCEVSWRYPLPLSFHAKVLFCVVPCRLYASSLASSPPPLYCPSDRGQGSAPQLVPQPYPSAKSDAVNALPVMETPSMDDWAGVEDPDWKANHQLGWEQLTDVKEIGKVGYGVTMRVGQRGGGWGGL